MARPHNQFTEEQIEILRRNQYVRSVGIKQVYFTEEFKRLYWQMYTEEKLMPYEILRQLGVDYHLIGAKRVQGITQNLKKHFGCKTAEGQTEIPKQKLQKSVEHVLERLRAENEYLKQELEFVKKIIAASKEEKR